LFFFPLLSERGGERMGPEKKVPLPLVASLALGGAVGSVKLIGITPFFLMCPDQGDGCLQLAHPTGSVSNPV